LIGGSSHVGKSTLANKLAAALRRDLISTDSLGRHPGRPWPSVLPQVAAYYTSLSDDTLHWFLKVHHENMWPQIRQVVEDYRLASKPFVLEGAALRPEYVAQLDTGLVTAIHLYGDADFLRDRMMKRSGYQNADSVTAAVVASV
jgi:2-phosphoglycerate kinase